MSLLLLSLVLAVGLARAGPVTFHDGVYDGFVISIGDDVPATDCSAILSNLEVSAATGRQSARCPAKALKQRLSSA
ncbi:hypothetical protein ONE63_006202 [Megalurothrips usitatus]|uniref:Uncharacterized protein n=1 Tax=Megalurothrips usitatus TaxID=439358 RepID=A0AAV7XWU6_9NEOP|nr:hypothetical protein ONE63_006202 [Megalurothrips usitatus]